jgi:Na+/pantothenate symporter
MFAYTIFSAGLIPIVISGFYKEKLRVTAAGAIAAIIGGGATGLISKINNIKYLDLGALAISVVLLFAVSGIERYIRSRQAKGK